MIPIWEFRAYVAIFALIKLYQLYKEGKLFG